MHPQTISPSSVYDPEFWTDALYYDVPKRKSGLLAGQRIESMIEVENQHRSETLEEDNLNMIDQAEQSTQTMTSLSEIVLPDFKKRSINQASSEPEDGDDVPLSKVHKSNRDQDAPSAKTLQNNDQLVEKRGLKVGTHINVAGLPVYARYYGHGNVVVQTRVEDINSEASAALFKATPENILANRHYDSSWGPLVNPSFRLGSLKDVVFDRDLFPANMSYLPDPDKRTLIAEFLTKNGVFVRPPKEDTSKSATPRSKTTDSQGKPPISSDKILSRRKTPTPPARTPNPVAASTTPIKPSAHEKEAQRVPSHLDNPRTGNINSNTQASDQCSRNTIVISPPEPLERTLHIGCLKNLRDMKVYAHVSSQYAVHLICTHSSHNSQHVEKKTLLVDHASVPWAAISFKNDYYKGTLPRTQEYIHYTLEQLLQKSLTTNPRQFPSKHTSSPTTPLAQTTPNIPDNRSVRLENDNNGVRKSNIPIESNGAALDSKATMAHRIEAIKGKHQHPETTSATPDPPPIIFHKRKDIENKEPEKRTNQTTSSQPVFDHRDITIRNFEVSHQKFLEERITRSTEARLKSEMIKKLEQENATLKAEAEERKRVSDTDTRDATIKSLLAEVEKLHTTNRKLSKRVTEANASVNEILASKPSENQHPSTPRLNFDQDAAMKKLEIENKKLIVENETIKSARKDQDAKLKAALADNAVLKFANVERDARLKNFVAENETLKSANREKDEMLRGALEKSKYLQKIVIEKTVELAERSAQILNLNMRKTNDRATSIGSLPENLEPASLQLEDIVLDRIPSGPNAGKYIQTECTTWSVNGKLFKKWTTLTEVLAINLESENTDSRVKINNQDYYRVKGGKQDGKYVQVVGSKSLPSLRFHDDRTFVCLNILEETELRTNLVI